MPTYTIEKSKYYCKTFPAYICHQEKKFLGRIHAVKENDRVCFRAYSPFQTENDETYPFYTLKGAIKFLEAARKIQENLNMRK